MQMSWKYRGKMVVTSPMPRVEDCKEDIIKCLQSHKQQEKDEYWDASMISMYFYVFRRLSSACVSFCNYSMTPASFLAPSPSWSSDSTCQYAFPCKHYNSSHRPILHKQCGLRFCATVGSMHLILGTYHFLPGGGASVCGGTRIFSVGKRGGPDFFEGQRGGGPKFFLIFFTKPKGGG